MLSPHLSDDEITEVLALHHVPDARLLGVSYHPSGVVVNVEADGALLHLAVPTGMPAGGGATPETKRGHLFARRGPQ